MPDEKKLEAQVSTISVEEIRTRIAGIAEIINGGWNFAEAHWQEDGLWEDVLNAIAAGATNAAELAREALKVAEIDFGRGYEGGDAG